MSERVSVSVRVAVGSGHGHGHGREAGAAGGRLTGRGVCGSAVASGSGRSRGGLCQQAATLTEPGVATEWRPSPRQGRRCCRRLAKRRRWSG